MNRTLVLIFVEAVLAAQPPADFEASVKAAMAPSIARQRVSIQQQVSSRAQAAGAPATSASAGSSFFTTPFTLAEAGAVGCMPLRREQLDSWIDEAGRRTGVDARLVRAVIDQASAERPCALSAHGAEGLMQLMPTTGEELDVEDPFDPKQNLDAGATPLKSLLEHYGNDPTLVLGAYNAGSGRADQQRAVPLISGTIDYVGAILEKLRSLDSKTESSAATSVKNSGW